MIREISDYTAKNKLSALLVHIFTASAAFFGVLTLLKTCQGEYTQALWLMGLTVIIDAVDGSLARYFRVKTILPSMDGALLDNLVDYLNYVITPCFFLLIKPGMLPPMYALWVVAAITLTSSWQFCQTDAKTPDHFFKGFPCYWNIALFYMIILDTSMFLNMWILLFFCLLIFIPVKYVYPSRLDYLTDSRILKIIMHIFSAIYAISALFILLDYPEINKFWLCISLGYVFVYFALSFYRTYSPLIKAKIAASRGNEHHQDAIKPGHTKKND